MRSALTRVCVVVVACLAACSSPEPTASPPSTDGPTASPTPSASPTPTRTPEPTPTAGPTSTPGAIPAELLGVDVERIPTPERLVALTFDGGSGNAAVDDILAALETEDVPATFFLTGEFARLFPGDVAAIAAAGHRLGNHSDTHAAYPDLTNDEIRGDLARAEDAIVTAAGGAAVKPLFRFPFGARTALDIEVVNGAGYLPVRWTVDTLGWQGTSGGQSAESVLQRVLDTATPGQIVLMHVGAHPQDGSTLDADALPAMIETLRARGYSFVTLDALLT